MTAKKKRTTRKTRKKVAQVNELPKYFTMDIEGSCVIYQLDQQIDYMRHTECLYKAVKCVKYIDGDGIVEEAVGANAKSVFLEVRDGTLLPDTYGDYDLTWYEIDAANPIELDDILTMCVI